MSSSLCWHNQLTHWYVILLVSTLACGNENIDIFKVIVNKFVMNVYWNRSVYICKMTSVIYFRSNKIMIDVLPASLYILCSNISSDNVRFQWVTYSSSMINFIRGLSFFVLICFHPLPMTNGTEKWHILFTFQTKDYASRAIKKTVSSLTQTRFLKRHHELCFIFQ